MSAFVDMTGMKYGLLTALRPVGSDRQANIVWECRCDCGSIIIVNGSSIRQGNTKSCGCFKRSHLIKMCTTHGRCNHPSFKTWKGMFDRCNNPNIPGYKNYGGRGIKVCKRWENIENFIADMGKKPSARHSIDRIDNDGDYMPENCRWATWETQQRNKRDNLVLTHNGKTMCVAAWADETGINRYTLYTRLKRGWTTNRALATKAGKYRIVPCQ